mmetsp:Transcript_22457/g.27518  ORF Transcript_22457/g.27518 Transcript_22457/m.27518 type:complete len:182 (+) Transcript_22457:590-1135(+)
MQKVRYILVTVILVIYTPTINLLFLIYLVCFMSIFKKQGIRVAICTSDDRAATNHCIRNWGLEQIIDFSICGDEVLESKLSAQPLLSLCKQAQVKPEDCIVVGDTSADTGMGCNANAGLVVGVLTGSGTTEQLLQTGADIVLPDISYLHQLIGIELMDTHATISVVDGAKIESRPDCTRVI